MAAIDFVELFTRLGQNGNVAYQLNQNQAALPAVLDSLSELYEDTADEDLVGGLLSAKPTLPNSLSGPMAALSPLASTTVIRSVFTSIPPVAKGVSSALLELIRQMRANSQTVPACTVTASAAALGTNVGNTVVVLTTKRGDGLVQENIVAEVLRLSCTNDSYSGTATAGQEQFRLGGTSLTAGTWNWNWPDGSSASLSLNAISSTQSGSLLTNLITGGSFPTFSGTPAEPANWLVSGGAWGTDLQQNTAAPYIGDNCVEFIAGTAANTILYQDFGLAAGTLVFPADLTSYAVNFFLNKPSGTITAGVLTVELTDDAGTVINDEQGVANSFTVDLTSIAVGYVAYNDVFRMPEVTPATARIRFRLSTALTGANFLLDAVCFSPVKASYAGGFGIACFSGDTPAVIQDGHDITTTNDRAGRSYNSTFQSLFDRFYGMKSLNLLLPSSATPTIPDSMITFPGIVAYYPFENNTNDSGGRGFDLSGGTIVVPFTYTTGKIGQGIDAGDVDLSAASVPSFPGALEGLMLGTPVSVAYWAFLPSLSGASSGSTHLVTWTTPTTIGLQVISNNTGVGYHTWIPGRTSEPDGELTPNAWSHLVWTWDGVSSSRIYVNGGLLAAVTYNPTNASFSTRFNLGVFPGIISGVLMDEVMVFAGVLSPDQISTLYNGGAGFNPTS